MSIVFWSLLIILVYIYVGYPLLLIIKRSMGGEKFIQKREFLPKATLIISAYNEEKVIRQKIENSLSLDYPSDKLEIFIVSDASTDTTDQIVSEYEQNGIVLMRMEERRGKTAGLNHAVSLATGEIIIFSDANAYYDPDAIRHLVVNFSDPEVGCVTGASRYIQRQASFVGWCENLYWTYDSKLKILESQIGSMVGGDGAIYAIRKKLYTPLQPQDINDFVNPLQIIIKGFRGIFEPAAVCYENTVHLFEEEYRRKVRIVSRSLKGLMQVPSLLNPLQFGFYSIELISHKLLRWFTPAFVLGLGLSNIPLITEGGLYQVTGTVQVIFYLSAMVGFLLSRVGIRGKLLDL